MEPALAIENHETGFIPIVRSKAWADKGVRTSIENVYLCVDNFMDDYGIENFTAEPISFYGVFDGHGGKHAAADFACQHLPRFIFKDKEFPNEVERVIALSFLQTDTAFAKACSLDATLASDTIALATLILGRMLVVANTGDCRAVICRRGKAIEMSKDHKPLCIREKLRLEASGGYVYDGYLNDQLNIG